MPGVFYGLTAMPSLHVAAVTMIMIFLFRASAIAGAFGLVYVCTTFLGSIFLQWHYAIDGYIGALMATVICIFCQKVPELFRPRGAS